MARVVPMLDSSIELDRKQGFAGLLAVAEADLFNPSNYSAVGPLNIASNSLVARMSVGAHRPTKMPRSLSSLMK